MSYRKRNNYSSKLKTMREARTRQIAEGPAPDYPVAFAELRRQLIVRDFDFGEVEHTINLYRADRVDCYDMAGVRCWRSYASSL